MPRTLKIWLALGGLLLALGLFFVIRFALNPTKGYHADGPAMEPTLFDGDDFDVRLYSASEVRVGDVVVARSPFDDVEIVKRVIATGGQSVAILGECAVEVDGRALPREPVDCPEGAYQVNPYGGETETRQCFREQTLTGVSYVTLDTGGGCRVGPSVDVPEGHVFLLGDHRDRSNDSTNPMIGPVPIQSVVGVVELADRVSAR